MDRLDATIRTNAQDDIELNQLDLSEVLSPIELPCGRVLSNRLVKIEAAMYEHLAAFLGGPPNNALKELYAVWAQGGWGMIITGNVQVSGQHLSLGADMVVPEQFSNENVARFKQLADAMKSTTDDWRNGHSNGPLAVMQLNHAGRQSPNIIGGRWPFVQRPLSASATRVGSSPESRCADSLVTRVANSLLFQEARAMTEEDVTEVVKSFVRGARLATESGFDGIQLHAAHGYLIAQFMSRKTNMRTDAYATPLSFLHEIVEAIRSFVPRSFIVGLKINAGDYAGGGFNDSEARNHFAELAQWEWDGAGIDFIEVSGGDYESPEFMKTPSPQQAMFEFISRVAVETIGQGYYQQSQRRPPLIMLTGGLRTRLQFSRVLARKHTHLLGIARVSILQPRLPLLLREYNQSKSNRTRVEADGPFLDETSWSWETLPTPEPRSPTWWPRLVGAGIGMAWYVVALHRLAAGSKIPYGENWVSILLEMYFGGLWSRLRRFISFVILLAAGALYFSWLMQ